MAKQILVNLPVQNLGASEDFFTSLGFNINEKFTNGQATCLSIDENIILALLPTDHFSDIIYGNTVAPAATSETLLAIGMETKQEVDDILDKAVRAGGSELHERVDRPEIYAGSFKDLDGHLWNIYCMR